MPLQVVEIQWEMRVGSHSQLFIWNRQRSDVLIKWMVMILQCTFLIEIGNSTACKLDCRSSASFFPLPGFTNILFSKDAFPDISLHVWNIYTHKWGKWIKTVNSTWHSSQNRKLSCSAVHFDCFPLGSPFQEKNFHRATHFKGVPLNAVFKMC